MQEMCLHSKKDNWLNKRHHVSRRNWRRACGAMDNASAYGIKTLAEDSRFDPW